MRTTIEIKCVTLQTEYDERRNEQESIRFYKDHKVRAVWNEEHNHWWFSALDIVGAINQQNDHEKNRNYWKYLKAKLRKEQNELVSDTTQLKLTASDGKKYNTSIKFTIIKRRSPVSNDLQDFFLGARWDSNPRHSEPQSDALTN